jgi:hypothetical protein
VTHSDPIEAPCIVALNDDDDDSDDDDSDDDDNHNDDVYVNGL